MAGKEKRMAKTVDFKDKEVFEGLEALALLHGQKVSAYFREVLTAHYQREKSRLK